MTQRKRLKYLFQYRPNEWIGLPEILSMNIAQYGSRLLDLRRGDAKPGEPFNGMRIINKTEHVGGVVHSWFCWDRDNLLNDDGTKKVIFMQGKQAVFA